MTSAPLPPASRMPATWKGICWLLALTVVLPFGLRAYTPAASSDARLLQLTQRIAALETELSALQQAESQVRAPFHVLDRSGRTILTIEPAGEGGAAITVGSLAGGGLRLGVGSSGAGFLNLRRADGVIAASIGQYKGGPMGVQIFNTEGAGTEPVAELSAGATDKGELTVGLAKSGGVTLASGASQAGLVKVRRADGTVGASIGQYKGNALGVQIFNESGAGSDPIIDLGGDADGGRLTVGDAAGKPFFRVSDSISPGAAVSVGKQNGRYAVSVANSTGTRLASIGEANNGAGGIWAFGKDGTMRAVMNGLTGEIHLLDSSGVSRATMAAAAGGDAAFSIRSAGNTTIARLGEGQRGGWLQLANSAGNATVEAGIHPAGVGLIRAFPVGSPGGGMVGMPGTFLLGRPGN